MSLNKVMLIGNLGNDPELRNTPSGQSVCQFNIATTRKWKDKDGQGREETEWSRIVVWGRQAENCKEYLAKGRQVFVEGRLQTRQWEDKDGNKRYTTEVIAQSVQFLSGGQRGQGSSGDTGGGFPTDNAAPDFGGNNAGGDDIPF